MRFTYNSISLVDCGNKNYEVKASIIWPVPVIRTLPGGE
ncbi:MAG: hypothetical protein A4E57_01609 [Syntrophorhabdaceae bacterium PtaU1.Bin034]|jgi:hypothetical protein|nr:MAG: hypothetical protein A4E57_01609 [Syntrophorhabdaceae bacterium PtaU1.Bin034]